MQPVTVGGVFNANQYEPQQGGSKHPVGMFPFTIGNTQIVPAQDGKSGMFRVTFDSPSGSIDKNYNLWHDNQQTVEIAHKQLSALCHAVGRFTVNMANQGRDLVGAQGTMEIGWQKDNAPGEEKGGPNGGYVEVKKVFDSAGNEPGKAKPAPQPQQQAGWGNQPQQNAPQQQPQAQPMQQQPGGSWGSQPQQQPQQQAPQQPQQQWGQQPQGQQPAPAWATQK